MTIYLDNQSTTRVDPRVVAAMLPTFDSVYANAGSISHELGIEAAELVQRSSEQLARAIGAKPREIVFTSGATESNCLAIFGYCLRRPVQGHAITMATEHKAVLDPMAKIERLGFEVTRLPVKNFRTADAGVIDLDHFEGALRDNTMFVSVMLANNEIGVIQPIAEIAEICHQRDIVLHCDATQAIGNMPVDVAALDVDLLSLSAHKFYGPKGVGALYVRQTGRRIRLASQIDGGGQQLGRRSGTLNVSGIVGMAKAIELAVEELSTGAAERKRELRDRLYRRLCDSLGELPINGPHLDSKPGEEVRMTGNLNCQFPGIEGQSLMLGAPRVAISSGSACTSVSPEPSHVLRALGLDDDAIRSSLRFGVGRFNTAGEIDEAAELLVQSVRKLGGLKS